MLINALGIFIAIFCLRENLPAQQSQKPNQSEINIMMNNVHWLGHSSIKITGKKVIYIDPFKISGGEPAGIIFITHDHYDHLSMEDIRKIRTDRTIMVVPEAVEKMFGKNVHGVFPGMKFKIEEIEVTVVPAYNIGKRYHPKEKQYVGYVIKTGGGTYYHAGDTDFILEMNDIKADVAFLPVGGTYTMDAKEAAQAANTIKPKVAVPIHYGTLVGSAKDAEEFKKLCKVNVVILKKE